MSDKLILRKLPLDLESLVASLQHFTFTLNSIA